MNIFEAINNVMADIGSVGKNQKNATQGFMYRGIDAVMNAINPALVKNKVFVVPTVLEQTREERTTNKGGLLIYSICKIKFTFYAEDGSSVEAITIGEGMDSGDKATNKAMSIAFKYACFQVFCIPTEEMADPDAESHEVAPKRSKDTQVAAEKISPEQKVAILKELTRIGDRISRDAFLEYYKVKSVDDLLSNQFNDIMNQFAKYK